MKQLLERARETVIAVERLLDSRMNLLVRNGGRAQEPLEVGHAILKELQGQAVRDAHGHALFPHAHVVVELRMDALPPGASLEPLTSDRLQAGARQSLAELDCRIPSDFSLEVRRVTQPLDGWPSAAVYRLRFDDRVRRQESTARAADSLLTLTLSPDHNPGTYQMLEDRLDIGSVADVRDRDGRLVRRNAVCVSGEADPKQSVSRRHAHITASTVAPGRVRYVLHDDASTYGTRVMRRGETIPVPPGTAGVRLRDGDEVYFGAARATVSIGGRLTE
jgi:hypothetical protein